MAFDCEVGGTAKDLRDVATQLDAYAVGRVTARLARRGKNGLCENVHPLVYWNDTGER